MAAFSYDKHHPFLVDSSSSLFLFPNTTTSPSNPSLATITNYHTSTNMSSFLEQSTHNNYNPCLSSHQHHPFSDQPDPTVDKSSSVNISTVSTSTTKVSTCSNNSSSSAVTALHQKQVKNPMDKRKNNFEEPHSKVLMIVSYLNSYDLFGTFSVAKFRISCYCAAEMQETEERKC